MNKSVYVQVLYTDGCPNLSPTIDLIERARKDLGLAVTIEKVLMTSQEQAIQLRCLGSPTVQINGVDIDPATRESLFFGLG